jgi:hypothetical protein
MRSALLAAFTAVLVAGIEGNMGRAAGGQDKPGAQRPNVIVILTDDQGSVDARCYGSQDLQTPAMDSLSRPSRQRAVTLRTAIRSFPFSNSPGG